MQKIIFFILLLITSVSHAQTNDNRLRGDTSVSIFVATGKGEADGEKAVLKIGKDGGNIKSSDNRIELLFPAGALSSATNISIQPITNLAQGGIGKGYSMEPSGILFNQPVQLIYHYTDTETEGDSPELMGLATQDEQGYWHQLNKIVIDTLAKTITGNIKHFSLYNPQWRILLQPRYPKVKVSKEDRIILAIAPKEGGKPEAGEISDAFDYVFGDETQFKIKWYVNGIINGNAAVGFMANQTFQKEMYKAPVQVPVNNPVKISVEIYSFNTITSKPFRKSCNVLVYDNAYEVKMVGTIKNGSIGKWGGVTTYHDEGSFIVSMEKNKPVIVSFENKLETIQDNCEKVILNPTTCTGLFHISGIQLIRVTPANPPGQPYPVVEISFVRKSAEFTKIQYNCPPPPGFKGGAAKGSNVSQVGMLGAMMPSLPMYVKFIAKDEEQVIQQIGKEGEELFYKIWVKKVKEE